MSEPGSGRRPDWKDRIDRSSWVDNTPWAGSESENDDPGVEFLEVEPAAFRLNQEPTEQAAESVRSARSSRLLALAAAAVVLAAIVWVARPDDSDPFEQLPTSDQQRILERREGTADQPADDQLDDTEPGGVPAGGTDDEESGAADPEITDRVDGAVTGGAPDEVAVPPPPIPRLRADLPDSLTGILYLTGGDGSLVLIDWAEGQIEEVSMPRDNDGVTYRVEAMEAVDAELIMVSADALMQLVDGKIDVANVDLAGLLPSRDGLTVVSTRPTGSDVFLLPMPTEDPSGEPNRAPVVFELPMDLNPVGRWGQSVVVEKAGQLWLYDADGPTAPSITDGQLLSFDGGTLAMLRCDPTLACWLEVGPPDNPNRFTLDIPDQLAGRDAASWGPSITVTNDGSRLALVDDIGAFTAPLTIDLATGDVTEGTDIVNGDSPLAWSPDGQTLAYAFGDDLVLWDLGTDRRYRVDVDREIGLMTWAPPAEDPASP